MELLPILNETVEIAIKAGEILRSYWGKIHSIKQKQTYWDLVTEADIASEAYILESIKMRFPQHQTISEEAGLNAISHDDTFQWHIDPLDGTTNFTHQYPMVSVSIGLLYKKRPIIGVVYNPILNELFKGAQGLGATFNDHPLQVSKVNHLEQSLLATGFAYDRKLTNDNNYDEFCHLAQMSQGIRRGGSAALDLAYVAAGRLDGYWERGLKSWDLAAGILLVQEAGGKVTSYENGDFDLFSGRILATNGHIHHSLSHELLSVKKRG